MTSSQVPQPTCFWKLGSWQLGSWQLAVVSWQLAVGEPDYITSSVLGNENNNYLIGYIRMCRMWRRRGPLSFDSDDSQVVHGWLPQPRDVRNARDGCDERC